VLFFCHKRREGHAAPGRARVFPFKNPLLRYVVLQVGFVLLAFGIGGFAGS
jgi:hypothetical protein